MRRRMRVSSSLTSIAASNLWMRFNTCELLCLLSLDLSCAEDCKAYIIMFECLLSCIEEKKIPYVIEAWHLTQELYNLFNQKAIFSCGTRPGADEQGCHRCVTTRKSELTQVLHFIAIKRTKRELTYYTKSSIDRTVPSLPQLPLLLNVQENIGRMHCVHIVWKM